jgi:hypothetical protein
MKRKKKRICDRFVGFCSGSQESVEKRLDDCADDGSISIYCSTVHKRNIQEKW